MRITKLFLTACFAFFTLAAFANEPVKGPNISNEIKELLTNSIIQFDQNHELIINFIVTKDNEIIVTSTNNKELDRVIKGSLNYKKVKSEIKPYTVYSQPVTLKKS